MNARTYQGIDHVVVRTADAVALHGLFSGLFGLPVTWPLERAAFATFGWIGLGNTHLEIWAAADNSDLPADCPLPLIHQIALAPFEWSATVSGLKAAGFDLKAPRTYSSPDERGQLRTNFTNSVILDLSSDACCVFICDWDDDAPITPWRKGLSTAQRRIVDRDALASCAGGPLGLIGLKEISITTPELPKATEKWQQLTQSSTLPMAIADGVALRLLEGPRDQIQSLTFAVRNLAQARRFLTLHGLIDADDIDGIVLSRRATGGLTFRFAESAPNA